MIRIDEITDKWLQFDIEKVKSLKEDYESTLTAILELLPPINWNSSKEIRHYLAETFDIHLDDAKISTLSALLPLYDEFSDEHDILGGAITYLKLKFTIHNYLAAILRHEQGGRVYLREVHGQWRMPNKQPIPSAAELTACIVASHL